tara:strand:+ start:6691 stop:7542 length:852 start_codon:yes stop_codon:yes gene_type:complete
MQDRIIVQAPAKLNLFLYILKKTNYNYHKIYTGITFLNLHDQISISLSNKNRVSYTGQFKPSNNFFKNDIIDKVLNNISLKGKQKIKVKIKKNIPYQAGLGSASTNAAALIRGLQDLKLVGKISNKLLCKIGSDVPACYYNNNCLVTNIGDKIKKNIIFPKLYFVLVYPFIPLSTSLMFSKINKYADFKEINFEKFDNFEKLSEKYNKNDFEFIAIQENKKIMELLKFLPNLKNNVFCRMTGSGSCCYAAFKNKKDADRAYDLISKKYDDYWIKPVENNIISK